MELKSRCRKQVRKFLFGPLTSSGTQNKLLQIQHFSPGRRISLSKHMLHDEKPAMLSHCLTAIPEDDNCALIAPAVHHTAHKVEIAC